MLLYAKIINDEIGLCEVGTGTNSSFYQSIGMTQLDVQQSDIDSNWYTIDKCPMKSDEQKQEEELARINALTLPNTTLFKEVLRTSGKTKSDIQTIIQSNITLTNIQKESLLIDLQGSYTFIRGSYFVITLGTLLNYTTEQLDYLFEHRVFNF